MPATFKKESDFEDALVALLGEHGWEHDVLYRPTEQDLWDNWAKILFRNNMGIDHLNNCPLTDGEMRQIAEQITSLRTPLKLNGFINGKSVIIKRDNPDDRLHYGREVSLHIYDRNEIAGGRSRYQIARQPVFKTANPLASDRRGDLMLLINGMPVIHIELKRSGIPVGQACTQIKKYSDEGVFTGIFSLVQVFVAMNPEETLYFANPGPDGRFNSDFYFHWADFNNETMENRRLDNYKDIAATLLSIPMAHQMIGFYTVADNSDGVLKVMRSYQYYAANKISDAVSKMRPHEKNQRGGYIWHTTGSGKTLTSFKAAQLIAASGDADKVVFLTDRIELGTQSFASYLSFADEGQTVQETEDSHVLKKKLKSSDPADMLIVTSIQKMSRIKTDENGMNAADIEAIADKRLVFIVDEAHRSVFGRMLQTIRDTFVYAMFFGFTGTPVLDENKKKDSTTATVFGNELHRYSLADGINDGNVLGFDVCKVLTFRDKDLREKVALQMAKANSVEDALANPAQKKIFLEYMDRSKVGMAGCVGEDGLYVYGIEDYIPKSQYRTGEHTGGVVSDIADNFTTLSLGGKFHAIFATSSVPEAITYYRLLKKAMPDRKVSCLFDPGLNGIDDDGGEKPDEKTVKFKEDGLIEIIEDYNLMYGTKFDVPSHAAFKKDLSARLAHKGQYLYVDREPEKQLDLLIVVNQMLTGFDSKYINTLYLDKLMRYESIIQAFSRTNRLFGPDKPFGVIRYYRKPHTMERNIYEAVKLYSGDRPFDLFVEKLDKHLEALNELYDEIRELFATARVPDFERLPEDKTDKGKFAKLFNLLNVHLEAAKVQGFRWDKLVYEFKDLPQGDECQTDEKEVVELVFDLNTFLTLAERYKELQKTHTGGDDVPYDIKGHIAEINTAIIDADFMNARYDKYIKALHDDSVSPEVKSALRKDLHKSFASLSQEDQKYANIILHELDSGDLIPEPGKTMRDYINDYRYRARNEAILAVVDAFGLNSELLNEMLSLKLTKANLDEFGRFEELKRSVDKVKARSFFESKEGMKLNPAKVSMRIDSFLRHFILTAEDL